MSARPDFADAVIKCERADVHIAAVQAEITRFLATEFYRIRFEHDRQDALAEFARRFRNVDASAHAR